MIEVRPPESIHVAHGRVDNGTFTGRWHFSFAEYRDPEHTSFGSLRVFNDDTLSPGAVWPLHPHRDIEVVTYCAGGEFRHADENGAAHVLMPGWVQHTTVGRGMQHSEINNRADRAMRFVQMWFTPRETGLEPSLEVLEVTRDQRSGRLLPIVSNHDPGALGIRASAKVYSCYLEEGQSAALSLGAGRGAYVYVLEGGPLDLNGRTLAALAAAKAVKEPELEFRSDGESELLVVEVGLMRPASS